MRNVCRIFIFDMGVYRSFYWFEYSVDHSIYFGSSNAKNFRTGYTGTGTSSATSATRVDPVREGRPMSADEIGQKHSVHGSGVVHQGTLTNRYRDRYMIAPPRDGFSILPLVAVLPMHPTHYPISTKRPKATDIVIDVGHQASIPFGAMFYLNKTEELEPPPIINAKSLYEKFVTASVPFGPCNLCASIYADSSQMKSWSSLEGTMKSFPEQPGGQPAWSFFSNTNGAAL